MELTFPANINHVVAMAVKVARIAVSWECVTRSRHSCAWRSNTWFRVSGGIGITWGAPIGAPRYVAE